MLGYKPIESHSKKDIDECYAKYLLEELFPNRYQDLAVEDKPDLRDYINDRGIEVTSSMPKGFRESLKFSDRLDYLNPTSHTAKFYKKIILDSGVRDKNSMLIWPHINYSNNRFVKTSYFNNIVSIFVDKVNKLNSGGYSNYSNNDLFIKTIFLYDDVICQELLNNFNNNNTGNIKFSFVYVLGIKKLCSFDLRSNNYSVKTVENDTEVYKKAYTLAKTGDYNGEVNKIN